MDRREIERSTKTHIAEMFALKSTILPGAAIDAHGVGITLRGAGVEPGMTEGIQIMHFALKWRNPCITEEVGKSSRMAQPKQKRLVELTRQFLNDR